jgi:acetolactate decarboxylase
MDQDSRTANVSAIFPASLELAVRDAADRRGISTDGFVSAVLDEYLQSFPRRIFQISTSAALVDGVSSGSLSSSTLLEHGDFGLGTFEGLNGEMIVLDGEIYQAAGDVRRRPDNFPVPFAAVTHFREEAVFQIENIASLKELELTCDSHRASDNLFYALRVDGLFDDVHARVVHHMPEKTRLLDAAKTQLEFHFHNVEGTLVCLWSPGYSSSFSVPGYHFHFISRDRTKGGHVLNCAARELRASIQVVSEYDVHLPETGPFLTTKLSQDPAADLAKAE